MQFTGLNSLLKLVNYIKRKENSKCFFSKICYRICWDKEKYRVHVIQISSTLTIFFFSASEICTTQISVSAANEWIYAKLMNLFC
jgi:hypothetical protein